MTTLIKRFIITIVPVLLIASCSSDNDHEYDDGEIVRYQPKIMIAGGEQAQTSTRTISDNTFFFPLHPFGMCVLGDDQENHYQFYHQLGYANIKCLTTWNIFDKSCAVTYQPLNSDRQEKYIGLSKNKGPVRIYALHPQPDNFDFTKYHEMPFEVGTTNETNYDYMCAADITIDPADPSTLNTPIVFNHIMTALEFKLKTSLVGELVIESITLDAKYKANGQPAKIFFMEGTFDASTGDVEPDAASAISELTITYDRKVAYIEEDLKDGIRYTSCAAIFPAVEYGAGTGQINDNIEITAYLNFEHHADEFNNDSDKFDELKGSGSKITFDLDDMVFNSKVGFHTGHKYVFDLTIDNFIKYQGFPEIGEWVDHEFEGGKDHSEIPF